jgi:class 3 adenylate cyclase
MEPRIQYAKTPDGFDIAFWTLGQGPPPLVVMPVASIDSLRLGWQIPEMRRGYERLAKKRMLVRYDRRGFGLSERNITAFSLDTLALNLAAVADHLELQTFALTGAFSAGPAAIAYTVAHPERVSRLVLWNAYVSGADYWEEPWVKAVRGMREADWPTYTEAVSRLFLGGPQFAALVREGVTPEVYQAYQDAIARFDVTHLLPQVPCSTLVLHAPAGALTTLDTSRALASHIPGARLAVVEGDMAAVAEAIDEFLGEGEEAAPERQQATPAGLQTILFTDIEGSTAMTQRLGDARAREVLRDHERIVRECLREHGGAEVKTMGDGFMASFGSATKALECAIAIQRAFEARNASLPAHPEALEGRAEPQPSAHASTGSARADGGVGASSAAEAIRVRIGLNAGEPIAEDDPDGRGDLFGTAVIRAARIAALAQGGEILVANVVRELAEGKGFMFGDRGEVALRGFDDPVRVFEVRWREDA